MNDIEIIKKCLDWDLKHFWKIYDKYIDKIYKFVYLKVSDKEIAEDIVGDVFLSALNNLKNFRLDENSSFNSWIYKIAHNKVIDYYKKNDKIKTEEICDNLTLEYIEDYAWNIESKDKLKQVIKYLQDIKKEHREIIIYRIWYDLSFNEISEITWKSVDNCKKISSRILKKINENVVYLLILLII